MSISPMIPRQAIESRAFYAASRIFGRYGVDVRNEKVMPEHLRSAMRRMTAKEYTCVIGAFATVMTVNGRMRPPAPAELPIADKYKKLQERAHHLKNHPKDLPKVAS